MNYIADIVKRTEAPAVSCPAPPVSCPAPPLSCSAFKQRLPEAKTGKYQINPKAVYNTSVVVNCDMNDKNGVGVTEIGHDGESSFKVLLQFLIINDLMFSVPVLQCFLYTVLII